MSMFKKIKSLFIEEDPNAMVNEEETITSPQVSQQTTNVQPPNMNPPVSADQLDQKFIDVLMKAIEQNNKEGMDYLEFKNSLQSLSKLAMDEATRFKSAFIMGKTMGLSKDILLQSVQHYLTIVNNEEKKFKEALQKQKTTQIQDKENQLTSVNNAIAEKEKQILKLKEEIDQHRDNLDKISAEINEAVVRIDNTNVQFLSAHKLISQQMMDDIQKIKDYIE
ncbi:MAG: hypothetical protein IPN49_14085 [Saprospiraceae bacterium]|nr:hypothetical protein [Saprospiraceae bacterium]MBK7522941.1 hypothetical protein [Saprospiraceae bacterium]MBK8820153.1 hypothetical protein [Saprospiraceae bacterium]